jgi:hypothetical protein
MSILDEYANKFIGDQRKAVSILEIFERELRRRQMKIEPSKFVAKKEKKKAK